MVTPSSSDTSVSNGVYVPGGISNGDVKPALSTTPLADFLMQLEDYTPTSSNCIRKSARGVVGEGRLHITIGDASRDVDAVGYRCVRR
ncbi:hypothetical protein CRUP_032404 [Coryphaenoides rupestris]|nr:hypothetical protein CRUP_032404 [Coryphaenoides rupestris]